MTSPSEPISLVLVLLIQTEALSGGLVEQCLMADILLADRGDLIAEGVHRTVGLAQIVVPVNFLVEGGQLVEYAIGVSREVFSKNCIVRGMRGLTVGF